MKQDVNEEEKIIQLTLFDGTNYVPFVKKINLILPDLSSSTFPVDIIIHKSLTNHEHIANWAKGIVNNYINKKFSEAGIIKRLRVGKVINNYDEKDGCLPGGNKKQDTLENDVTCQYYDGRIRLWFLQQDYPQRARVYLPATSADPTTSQVWQGLPSIESGIVVGEPDYYGKDQYADTLMHEIGHLFDLYDYYREEVPANNNEVVPIRIEPYAKDIMYSPVNYDHFSPISKEIVNKVLNLPRNTYVPNYTPKQIILKIADDNNIPLNNIKVELYQQRSKVIYDAVGQATAIAKIIPNKVKFLGLTNENGEYSLGDAVNMFGEQQRFDSGMTVFLRISKDNEVRYWAITYSYLIHLYFQGQTDAAIINLPFSSLISVPPVSNNTKEGLERY